ncbi:DUF1707 SHOCT-like domain-containing protein [Solicola gregarius]|uniref:DUF1707 domain-containing protein n=1 Tax=Solicola gregarius TaxID=2908642 RepID=A0AA46YM10_9ACTN|nr:DUF1707 domain-containing protein [Solicola gregarius]UYM07530.1 DUF1707 domain-containing protein [Solicola gregarius]
MTEPSDSIEPAESAATPDRRESSELRVSDADRDAVVRQLGEHAGVGRLTLAEHEERIEQAMEAKTRGQLDELLSDLPEATAQSPERRRKVSRWILSVMGGTDRTGRWRVAEEVNAITIMGGCEIDLRNAELDGDDVVINAYTWMGGTDIYVPDSIDLEVTGFSLMGERTERGSARRPRPGAPRVRIRSFNLMGGCDIYRLPEETRDLSGRRAARELRRQRRGGFGHRF